MRSVSVGGQDPLPFAAPERSAADRPAPVRRRAAGRHDHDASPPSYRLGAELVVTRGWPAGTEVLVDPGLRPGRGDVVAVREQQRVRVGVFERRFGRSVLVTDQGVGWIGPAAEILGVVTMVGAALEGMPDPR